MMAMLDDAFVLAYQLHEGQVRKGTKIPYVSHVMAVSALVLEDSGTEIAAAGGLLHDAAEDQGGWATIEQIRARCGGAVADVVVACSDSLLAKGEVKEPWRRRKEAAIRALPMHTEDALRVIAADKLHNAQATLTDLRILGPVVWSRFKTGREGFLWYHEQMFVSLADLLPGSRSVARLRNALDEILLVP